MMPWLMLKTAFGKYMISFKDMTFCSYSDCARFTECPRAFTDEQLEAAKQWWGGDDAPVAFFGSRPVCFMEKEQ